MINLTARRLQYNGGKITVFFSKFFKNAKQDLEKLRNLDNATKFKIMCI